MPCQALSKFHFNDDELKMHLMYTLDEQGKRIYTLKVIHISYYGYISKLIVEVYRK